MLVSTNPSELVKYDKQNDRLQILYEWNVSRNYIQISMSEVLGKRCGSLIKFNFVLCP